MRFSVVTCLPRRMDGTMIEADFAARFAAEVRLHGREQAESRIDVVTREIATRHEVKYASRNDVAVFFDGVPEADALRAAGLSIEESVAEV